MIDGKIFSDIEVSRHNGMKSIKIVALVIQHAVPMRRIILSSVACPAVPYFRDGI
jgi:hypothetical protein